MTEVDARPSSVEERWILARLDAARADFERDLDAFDFAHAVDRLYHLTFDDFCDWYLESIKPRLAEPDVQATAFAALERLLKLLHPVMPHVTEEIWSHLPARTSRLIVAPWPERDSATSKPSSTRSTARRRRRASTAAAACASTSRATRSGSSTRSCARPGNGAGRRRRRARAARRRRSSAPRRCSRTRSSSRTRRRDVVEAERVKLEQYRPSLTHSATDWVAALSPWPADGFGTERMRALLARARRPAAALRRDPRRRHERQVDDDAA